MALVVVAKLSVTTEKSQFGFPAGLSIAGGVMMITAGAFTAAHMSLFPNMGGMMMGYQMTSAFMLFSLWGIVCGVITTIVGYLMYKIPSKIRTWGILVLIVSIASWFELGGFVMGSILATIGGIIAIIKGSNNNKSTL